MKNLEQYIGQKFNLLTIEGVSMQKTKAGIAQFIVKCDCGNRKEVNIHNVFNNNTKSCGCLHKTLLLDQIYSKKYNYNEDFFENLNEDSFYVLGLLYTDGNISKELGKGSIALKENDIDILKKISLLVKNDDKLIYISGKPGTGLFNNYYSNPQYKFYFCNKKIYKDLINLGLCTNKTKILKVDEKLKDSLHFWRGVMDGDGSVRIKTYKTGKRSLTISMCSASLSFINSFRDFCYKNTETKVKIHKLKSRDFYVFSMTGKDATDIFKLLYDNNSNLYLERKKKYLKEIL